MGHLRDGGEELGPVVRNLDPPELEVSERLVESRQSAIDPCPEIANDRVLGVRHREQEHPPLTFHPSCPQLAQLV
jgi:hypothetical protein